MTDVFSVLKCNFIYRTCHLDIQTGVPSSQVLLYMYVCLYLLNLFPYSQLTHTTHKAKQDITLTPHRVISFIFCAPFSLLLSPIILSRSYYQSPSYHPSPPPPFYYLPPAIYFQIRQNSDFLLQRIYQRLFPSCHGYLST